MRITDVKWDSGTLSIYLNHATTPIWEWAFCNMGSYTSVYRKDPQVFVFRGNKALISAEDVNESQRIIDHFKGWLPQVAQVYKSRIMNDIQAQEQEQRRKIEAKIAEEEEKKKAINASLRF